MTNKPTTKETLGELYDALIKVALAGLFFLLAWNFGISEVIQNLGGPDANINYVEALLTWVGARLLTRGNTA